MPFQREDRRFTLWLGNRAVIECRVRRVEPGPRITIKHPVTPAFRVAKFRFERPPIAAPVDQFRAAILSSRSNDLQTHSQQPLLFPLHEFFRLHRRAAYQIHGKAKSGIQQARTVYRSGLSRDGAPKIPYAIRERARKVCRTTKEIQRVIVAEDWYVVRSGCVADRHSAV